LSAFGVYKCVLCCSDRVYEGDFKIGSHDSEYGLTVVQEFSSE